VNVQQKEGNSVAESYQHEFLGHHTCSDANGLEYIEQHAPFWADYEPEKGKLQFLGSGYYFWDDNEAMAHHWGIVHYGGDYAIVEGDLKVPPELFLDLVGDRKAMKYIQELSKRFEEEGTKRGGWSIGMLVEFLKTLDEKEDYKGIFPFKIIRAIDASIVNQEKQFAMKFVLTGRSYTFLNPRIIICLNEKKSTILHSKRLIK
jgi:hypothetical protein